MSRNFNGIVERRGGTTIYTALALPFVLHMLRVYYAALCDDICEHRATTAAADALRMNVVPTTAV